MPTLERSTLFVCLFVCLSAAVKNERFHSAKTWYRDILYKFYGFVVERSKVKVKLIGLGLTAIRREFELYECLLVS